MRAAILIEDPIELAVDGPSRKLYTPLGPLLAAGFHPAGFVEAVAITTGGREWFSPSQPLIQSVPSVMTPALLREGLQQLKDEAEKPPVVEDEIALHAERPFLPDEILTSRGESS